MATNQQVLDRIEELQGEIDALNSAEPSGPDAFIVGSQTLTKAQLDARVNEIRRLLAPLQKSVAPYLSAKTAFDNATAELKRAQEVAANPLAESPTGMSQAQANAAVEKARKKVATAKSKFDAEGKKDVAINIKTSVRTGGRGLTPEESVQAARGRVGVGGGFGRVDTRTEAEKKKDRQTNGGGGTGAGGAGVGGGAGTGAGAGGRNVVPRNWEEQFRRMFPNQSWLLDLDRAKYPKLFALIQRGVADRMYESQEGLARFDAELRNTDFYVELRNTDKVRQIKSLVGDLGFDTVPFNKFLTTASNMGWEGETLQQEVYKEAFRKNDAGQYVNPTAVTRAKASNNYLQVANIGKAYFSQVADTTVENALTGVITSEDVQRQQRELAKTKYGHLSNLIDQGFTLEELASPFKQQAAQLLERSPDDINMGDAIFEAAYNYGDTSQKRMMTTGEWEIMLRSDAKYGWDKTQNAKQEARQLASSIAQAFGKVI
jgi:hypothetical protein